MSALTTESTFSNKRVGGLISNTETLPVGAGAKLFGGAIVGLLNGYAVSLAAFPQAKPIGCANGHPDGQTIPAGGLQATVDNTAGSAGALSVVVERGVFLMKNSATVEALSAADTGESVYFVDDQTVSKQSNNGNRPVVGTFLGLDAGSGGCWVMVGVSDQERIIETGLAGVDLSGHQYGFVKYTGGSYTKAVLGDLACGVLQNAPTNGNVARVCIYGPSLLKAGAGFTVGLGVASDANGLGINTTKAILGAIATTAIATANATAPGAGYVQAEAASCATLANAIKAAFNTLITDLTNTPIKGSNSMGIARETAAGAETKMVSVGKMGLTPTTLA